MTIPCGDTNRLLDTELQVVLEAIMAYDPPRVGPDVTLLARARKKIANQLEAARKPFVEAAHR